MRLAAVLLVFILGCASLATYNLFVRPLPKGGEIKQDASIGDWIHLAIYGEVGSSSGSSGGSRSSTMYQWTDSSGNVRFTENPAEIPPGAKRQVVR